MKKRSCLFCYFSFLFSFVELKNTKTSSEVKKLDFLPNFFVQLLVSKTGVMRGNQEKVKKYTKLAIKYSGYEKSTQGWATLWIWSESEHYPSVSVYFSPIPSIDFTYLTGKWLEHRGSERKCLYGEGNLDNARNQLIIGVRNVLVLTSRWTMMDDDMSIISWMMVAFWLWGWISGGRQV